MTKKLLGLAMLAMTFVGCKKCYECTLTSYQYCYTYTITVNGVTDSDTNCYSSETDRDLNAAAHEFAGATVTRSEGDQTLGTQELCGNTDETDDFVSLWETAGYTCAEQ